MYYSFYHQNHIKIIAIFVEFIVSVLMDTEFNLYSNIFIKQYPTLVVISYKVYQTHQMLISCKMTTHVRSPISIFFIPARGLSHVLPYIKPNERPQPSMLPPVQSDELKFDEPKSHKILRLKDLLYNMAETACIVMTEQCQCRLG